MGCKERKKNSIATVIRLRFGALHIISCTILQDTTGRDTEEELLWAEESLEKRSGCGCISTEPKAPSSWDRAAGAAVADLGWASFLGQQGQQNTLQERQLLEPKSVTHVQVLSILGIFLYFS